MNLATDIESASALQHLWESLTFQAGFNTNTVLRGSLLLGVASGVVGSFLLLRKRSLVADALSHAALPGVALGFLLAVALGQNARSLLILLPAAAVTGLLGVFTIQGLSRLPRVREDASIGIVLSVFFAFGIVLLDLARRSAQGQQAGLKQFIFGQAAVMTASEANVMAVMTIGVIALTLLLFKEMRLLCFDLGFANSLGFSSTLLDALLLSMVTAVTVVGLSAVGAVLMVALLIIPPVAARFWTDRLWLLTCIAATIGGIGCLLGAAASATWQRLPTGPAVVVVCGSMFLVSLTLAPNRGVLMAMLRRVRLARLIERQHLLRAALELTEIRREPESMITIDDLASRRRWSRFRTKRALRRAARHGEVTRQDNGYALTSNGRDAALRIVRSHRLWETYLTTVADVSPSHVDRSADDIEHVLGEELVRQLERALADRHIVPDDGSLPRSPHDLTPAR